MISDQEVDTFAAHHVYDHSIQLVLTLVWTVFGLLLDSIPDIVDQKIQINF